MDEELRSAALKKKQLAPIKKFKFESTLTDKFGRDGLRVYFLLNGKNTVADVLERTGLDESKLMEVLEFMQENELVDLPSTSAPAKEEPKPKPKPKKIAPRVMSTFRSPAEKTVYEKFGDAGLKVYRLMDSVSTPEQIVEKAGISEDELLEMLDFMDKEGLIKLEKPAEEEQEPEELPEEYEAPEPEEEEPEEPEEPEPVEEPLEDFPKMPVVVPRKIKLGIFGRLKIEAELLKRFGQKGMHAYSMLDGKRNSVKLAKETGYPVSLIDDVLDYLQKENAVDLRELEDDEIRDQYGEEGVSIYDAYGRDGLLIYEMINKRATIKDIIKASGVDPRKGIQIFGFIHRVLGIDIPLDTQLLKRQLGVK